MGSAMSSCRPIVDSTATWASPTVLTWAAQLGSPATTSPCPCSMAPPSSSSLWTSITSLTSTSARPQTLSPPACRRTSHSFSVRAIRLQCLVLVMLSPHRTHSVVDMAFNHVHVPNFVSPMFCNTSLRGRYGDAVSEMDYAVGQILQSLLASGADDNTIVFLTSE